MAKFTMEFDYAISFSGAEREIARQITLALQTRGLKIFFDENFENELIGKDGVDYLNDIFFRKSKYCIGLLSKSYEESAWTQLERRAIQAREFITEPGYLIPVLIDNFHPDWLLPTRIYFDLSKKGVDKLVDILVIKITNSTLDLSNPGYKEDTQSISSQYKLIEGEISFNYITREKITHRKRTLRQALQNNCLGYRSSFHWTGEKIELKSISPGHYIKYLNKTSLHEAYEVTFDIPLDKNEVIETAMEWDCEDYLHKAVKMLEVQIKVPMDKMTLRVKFPDSPNLSSVVCRIQRTNETFKPLESFAPKINKNNEVVWSVVKPNLLHYYKILWDFEGEVKSNV